MTTNRTRMAWRLGWAIAIGAAVLAPRAADAAWYSWLVRLVIR